MNYTSGIVVCQEVENRRREAARLIIYSIADLALGPNMLRIQDLPAKGDGIVTSRRSVS